MMELYGYEMHSVDEIETLLDIDSAFILKLIAMMKDNILGISSVVENMSDYASFDEKRQMILILRYMVQSRKQRKQKLPTSTRLMSLKMQIYLIMNQTKG